MKTTLEKDTSFYTVWMESYKGTKLALIPLGRYIMFTDRKEDPRLWNDVLPDSEDLWAALTKSVVKCTPQERDEPEANDEDMLSSNMTIHVVRGTGQIVAGAGGTALDIVDAATSTLLPAAIRGVSKVAVVGAVLAPISLGLDIYNIVNQAQSKAELAEKMNNYVANLKENLGTNRSLPLKEFSMSIDAFQTRVDQISV